MKRGPRREIEMSHSDDEESPPLPTEPGQSTVVLKSFDPTKLAPPPIVEEAKHFLVVVQGPDLGTRFALEGSFPVLGRATSADIVLADAAISSKHCRVTVREETLLVEDLGSSNGTYIDDKAIDADTPLTIGHLLRIGTTVLKHEFRSQIEVEEHAELENDIDKAARYVESILPQPYDGRGLSIRWKFRPSTRLGGDAFCYDWLDEGHLALYLIDVCGHGTGAALHSVSVIQQLRTRTLSGVDFRDPEAVLRALNETFQMEDHAGMYFSAWYGVYQRNTGELCYASAGHPPAFLISAEGSHRLQTKRPAIGLMPGVHYTSNRIPISTPARLFVYSDGVFELVDSQGTDWTLDAFLALLGDGADRTPGEQLRHLEQSLVALQGHDNFDDDQSVLIIDFMTDDPPSK